MATSPIPIASTPKRRFVMTPRRWATLSAICFFFAAYYVCYEHFPVHVTKDTPLYRVTRNGKYGIVTTGGRIVVPFEWARISELDDAGFAVTNTEVSPATVNRTDRLYSQIVAKSVSGVIDKTGREVIPATLSTVSREFDNHGEYHGVRDNKLISFDRTGHQIRQVEWLPVDECCFGEHDLMAVKRGVESGWMDRSGSIVLRPPDGLSAASNFLDFGLALVKNSEGLLGCVNKHGEVVIAPEWTTFSPSSRSDSAEFRSPILQVWRTAGSKSVDTQRGLFTIDGMCIVPPKYERLEVYFNRGLIRAKRVDGTYCCLNFDGFELPLPSDLEVIHLAGSNGKILAKQNGKYGWFTTSGEISIPFEYDAVRHESAFSGSQFAIAKKSGKWGLIDEQGEPVVPFKYDDIADSLQKFGLYVAEQNGLKGCINDCGDTIIPFEFTHLGTQCTGEYFTGRQHPLVVVFDREGNSVSRAEHLQLSQISKHRTLEDLLYTGPESDRGTSSYFVAQHIGESQGVYHAQNGLIIPPVHNSITATEYGFLGFGVIQPYSYLDESLSWIHAKLHGLFPSLVLSFDEVCILYDFNGNVIWRNDARLFDFLKAFGLSCWGLYCFRRYRIAKREERMMQAV